MHRRFVHRLTSSLAPAVAIALVVLQSAQFAKAQAIYEGQLEGPIAVVNKDIITYSQVRQLVGEQEKAAGKELKGQELVNKIQEIRLAALNELVDRQLILQEFKKQGTQIPDELVDQRIAAIIRDKFGGDREAFLRNLAAEGYTLDRCRQLERDKISVTEMRREVIAGNIQVSEAQISDYYRRYDTSGKSLKELHEEIEKTLVQNESKRVQEDWIKKLRKAAYIKIY